jgi:hypothetical protein
MDAAPDASDDPRGCAITSLDYQRSPTTLVLALPNSLTLNVPLEIAGGRTGFEATRSSLLEGLAQTDPRTYVGLAQYPFHDDCTMSSVLAAKELRDSQHQDVLTALLTDEATPTGPSSTTALLEAAVSAIPAVPFTFPVILLFLDGAPVRGFECGDGPEALAELEAQLRRVVEDGIADVLFIAAPGSGAGNLARELSDAMGCADCAFDFSSEPDFGPRFQETWQPSVSLSLLCDFVVPPSPEDGAPRSLADVTITVTIDENPPEVLPRHQDCSGRPGFTVSELEQRIAICPATCGRLADAFSGNVRLSICVEP